MPTYEYACRDCGHRLEAVQKFTDDPLTTCPECGGSLRKHYGSVGVVFKGSGWYHNDSRAGSGSGSARSDGSAKGDSGSSDSSGGSAKGDTAGTKTADESSGSSGKSESKSTAGSASAGKATSSSSAG